MKEKERLGEREGGSRIDFLNFEMDYVLGALLNFSTFSFEIFHTRKILLLNLFSLFRWPTICPVNLSLFFSFYNKEEQTIYLKLVHFRLPIIRDANNWHRSSVVPREDRYFGGHLYFSYRF